MRVLTVVILYILLYLGLMIPIIILLAAILGNQLENPQIAHLLDLVLGLGGFILAGFVLSKIVRKISYYQPYLAEIDEMSKSPEKTPAPSARMAAVVVDTLVVLILLFVGSRFILVFQFNNPYITIATILIVFVLYEPICVALFKGSIGHYWRGFRVVTLEGRRVNILVAILRFLIKSVLGLFSFVLFFLGDRRAIQDILTRTKVVYR
jgi:uncharacterized RDD family membrane protein YckC